MSFLQTKIDDIDDSAHNIKPLLTDAEIKQLNMPVAMFVGEKDIIIHPANAVRRLKSLLPNAQITVLPVVGHMLINLANKIVVFLMVESNLKNVKGKKDENYNT